MKRYSFTFTDKYYLIVGETNSYVFSTLTNKILKPWNHTKGYLKLCIRQENKTKKYYVHSLVMNATKKIEISDIDTVDHTNGNKKDNHPSNLSLMSRADNIKKWWGTL